jgi:DNA replication and repair protein RecF
MQLEHISINNYRNIERAEVSFGSRFNLLYGNNGQGKTNVLEAIFFLATVKSFRHARQAEIVAWGKQGTALRCSVTDNQIRHDLAVCFDGHSKQLSVDGKTAGRLTEYCSHLSVVAFSPEELIMVSGAPEQRRRYLDRAIFSSDAGYLKHYHDYFRALKQRNQLLRNRSYHAMDAWNEQLVETAARLIIARHRYVTDLAGLFREFYGIISGSDEIGQLWYHAHALEGLKNNDEVRERLRSLLVRNSSAERERCTTLVGPHRDDLVFLLDGKPIRQHGSQGQQKSFVLAMKMAEIEYLTRKSGSVPICLLDDMTAELDHHRVSHLLSYLVERRMQVFITTTDPATVSLPEQTEISAYRVRAGRLEQ